MSLSDLDKLRSKWFTLVTVNILQPVEKSLLVEQLKSRVGAEQIDSVLDELIKEGRVSEQHGRYRLTYHGEATMIPGRGRVLRDIRRMEYLVRLSKQRGGS